MGDGEDWASLPEPYGALKIAFSSRTVARQRYNSELLGVALGPKIRNEWTPAQEPAESLPNPLLSPLLVLHLWGGHSCDGSTAVIMVRIC